MKKIYNVLMTLALVGAVSSCGMDTEIYQYKDAEGAFSSVKDLSNAINGAYYYTGYYGFMGRDVVAIGDIMSGLCKGSEAKGWYAAIGSYSITTSEAEFKRAYSTCYKVIDQTTRIINNGQGVIGAEQFIDEAYGLRALSNWYLVNLFALPYQSGENNLGIVLVDEKPIEPFQELHRATVGETYKLIEKDLNAAIAGFQKDGDRGAFYMNLGAAQALKARVALDKKDYSAAASAAQAAIAWKGTGNADAADNVPSNDTYLTMWFTGAATVAMSQEDIFTIVQSSADNNGSSSLSNLYGSYENTLSIWTESVFDKENDIRWQLIDQEAACGLQPMKYRGTPTSIYANNLPVFRKSEMALILAEAYAQQGDLDQAKNYLTFTAKRNAKFESDILPTLNSKDDIMAFLQNERIREFIGEGHYWFDARRLGYKVQSNYYNEFDIQKFMLPIPEDEMSANVGIEQNTDWSNNVPKK